MPIFVSPTTPDEETALHFSGKKTEIRTLTPKLIAEALTFCTCATQCVPALPAFTDEIGTDFYKNDKFRMYMRLIPDGTVVALLIDKNGIETPLVDNTFGSLVEFAGIFYTYEIDWFKVFDNLGYGTYHIKIENLLGADVIQSDQSPDFVLRKFTDKAANGTVRIETLQRGKLQHDKIYSSAPLGNLPFRQQIRFKGSLKFLTNVVQNSDLQLNNPNRSLAQIKDQVFPEYELLLGLVSSQQVAKTLFDYLFANEVAVSDYNVLNHVIDPRDYSAEAYRSVPIKREDESSEPTVNNVRKTYKIKVLYANKNVFKINN